MRHKNDFYPTPFSICSPFVNEVHELTQGLEQHVWEPCAGDGRLVRILEGSRYKVTSGDISNGQDFFEVEKPAALTIATNPPFNQIRRFIDYAFEIGVQRMALIVPERIFASKIGLQQFQRHKPSKFINMSWREDYLEKGGSPDRALAAAFWQSPCADKTEFDVWEKPDF